MCGITGIVNRQGNGIDVNCVLEAAQLLRHRGPDDEGYLLLDSATGAHSLRNGPDTAERRSITRRSPIRQLSRPTWRWRTAASPSSTCPPAVTSR